VTDEERVADLEKRLGIGLPERGVALQALTHTSYVNEHPEEARAHNERLELLGDAVVDLAVCDRLMRRFPEAQEGELTRLRAAIVHEEGLATVARALGLGELLLLGHGEELTGGRDKSSLLANALEAVLGAAYLCAGMGGVLPLVDRLFGGALDRAPQGAERDYKTALQELVQGRLKTTPRYRVVREQGPDHRKTFLVEIEAAGERLGTGEGKNKKDAEQAAAREALDRLLHGPKPPSDPEG
jgi:ribonuclease III